MDVTFVLNIDQIQPSQLFISSSKLKKIMQRFDTSESFRLPPIPIKMLDGEYVATDGHTRLLAWFLSGYTNIDCVWEDIEMDWDEYRIYVQWCKEEGIRSIVDLEHRVITPNEYQSLWLDRCRELQISRMQK